MSGTYEAKHRLEDAYGLVNGRLPRAVRRVRRAIHVRQDIRRLEAQMDPCDLEDVYVELNVDLSPRNADRGRPINVNGVSSQGGVAG